MEKSVNKNILYILNIVIGLGIMFFGKFVPPIEPLTPLGVNMLTIFIGLAYLWITTDGIWASLLCFVAIAVTGYMPFLDILGSAFSNSIVLMLLFCFILFGSVMSCGVTPYIANFFLTRKVNEGRPLVLVFMMMAATYVMSACTSLVPSILLMWTIAYAILDKLDYKKNDRFSTLLIFAIFFGGSYGGSLMPFKGAIVMGITAFEGATGIEMDYYTGYMLINILLFFLTSLLYCLMIKYVFRADLSKMKNVKMEQLKDHSLPPMNKVQKINLLFVVLFILLVLGPTILPGNIPAVAMIKSFDAVGIAMILVAVLLIIRVDGKPIADFKKMACQGIQWQVVFMVASASFISGIINSPDMGVLPFFEKVLKPILGTSNEWIFAFIILLTGTILTSFFHNGILATMLAPIIATFSAAAGFNGVAICILMIQTIHILAFLTPAASVYAPLIHGNTEWISKKDIYIIGGAYLVVNIICIVCIGLPVANVVFSM